MHAFIKQCSSQMERIGAGSESFFTRELVFSTLRRHACNKQEEAHPAYCESHAQDHRIERIALRPKVRFHELESA